MALVNVIINCYNGERFLRETLNSIIQQTFNDYEIIFIDNCSTDNSADIAKTFGEKLKYYRTEINIPLGQARNFALSKCSAKYICFLDSDDLWEKDKLEKQIELLESDEKIAISMTNHYILNMIDNSRKVFFSNNEYTSFLSYKEFAINYRFALSSFVIRRDSFLEFKNWFDDRLSYAEEYDFFLRIALTGKISYINSPLSTYRIHESMTSKRLKESIPSEYEIVLSNLNVFFVGFDDVYSDVSNYILYQRDFNQIKIYIERKDNKKAREVLKRIRIKNKKTRLFFILSFMPKSISYRIYCKIYRKKI